MIVLKNLLKFGCRYLTIINIALCPSLMAELCICNINLYILISKGRSPCHFCLLLCIFTCNMLSDDRRIFYGIFKT